MDLSRAAYRRIPASVPGKAQNGSLRKRLSFGRKYDIPETDFFYKNVLSS